jgi:glutamyl-tRNA reductase
MHTKDRENIQYFWAVGINYKKTDASVRGLFAINNEQYDELLTIAPQYNLRDFFILSTCNRTEIYGFSDSSERLIDFICSATAGDAATFAEMGYAKNGYDAIGHLYSVGAGLDSQILGDYEILGQIKNAVKVAKAAGFIGTFSERLVNSVIQCSKAVKTNTALSGGTVSVSFAAVQYIKDHFHEHTQPVFPVALPLACTSAIGSEEVPAGMFPNPGPSSIDGRPTAGCVRAAEQTRILLIGTGKIGRSTCKNLKDYLSTADITLINRTEEVAVNLAVELGLKSAPITDLNNRLAKADVVLVSTNAPLPIIYREHLEGKGAKLVIDLSVPCNVADDAQHLDSVTFVNVDTLSKIKDETLQKREAEVPKAKEIIEEHIAEFKSWHEMRRHVPVLKDIKNKLKEMHVVPALAGDEQQPDEERIQKVVNAFAAKMRRDNKAGCNYIQAINEFIG